MDVGAWLRELGLGEYERAFRDNHIDAAVLAELTADDLTGLGIVSIGHRRKLLAGIAGLPPRSDGANTAPARALEAISGSARPRDEAERRQLTVMFCDLVGSTALAAPSVEVLWKHPDWPDRPSAALTLTKGRSRPLPVAPLPMSLSDPMRSKRGRGAPS